MKLQRHYSLQTCLMGFYCHILEDIKHTFFVNVTIHGLYLCNLLRSGSVNSCSNPQAPPMGCVPCSAFYPTQTQEMKRKWKYSDELCTVIYTHNGTSQMSFLSWFPLAYFKNAQYIYIYIYIYIHTQCFP